MPKIVEEVSRDIRFKIEQLTSDLQHIDSIEALERILADIYPKLKRKIQEQAYLGFDTHAVNYVCRGQGKCQLLAKKLARYVQHKAGCPRASTANGGYRTKFKGKSYRSRPANEEPKCNCGLGDVIEFSNAVIK